MEEDKEDLYKRETEDLSPEVEENISPAVLKVRSIEVLCSKCSGSCFNAGTGKKQISVHNKSNAGDIFICFECGAKNKYSESVFNTEIPSDLIETMKQGKSESKKSRKLGKKQKKSRRRHYLQLSLDPNTIEALKRLDVNKSRLFEELLMEHYPDFKEMVEKIAREKNDDKL